MKTFGYLLMAVMACMTCSCRDEEPLPDPVPPVVEPENPGNPEEPDTGKVYLGIAPIIENMQEQRAVVENWKEGHCLGVTAAGDVNIPFTFDGRRWKAGKQHEPCLSGEVFPTSTVSIPQKESPDLTLTGIGVIAISRIIRPYINPVRPAIPHDNPVGLSESAPILLIHRHMVHVHLTVITGFHIQSVSIDHAGIPHMGRRQGIGEIPPVHMYIDSDTLSRTHRHQDCLHIYRRGIVQCVVPSGLIFSGLSCRKELSGRDIHGRRQPYTSKSDRIHHPVTCIIILFYQDPDQGESMLHHKDRARLLNAYSSFSIHIILLCRDVHRYGGHVRILYIIRIIGGHFLLSRHLHLLDGDRIVEQYQPFDIKCGNGAWDGYCKYCYVQAVPGTYRLAVLFKKNGESAWFKPYGYDQNSNDGEWMYEVRPATDMPALRMITLENQKCNTFLAYPVPDNDWFNIVYTLSNKSRKAMKGTIKVVWEREFKLESNSYRPSAKADKNDSLNDEEWRDELGSCTVDIAAGVRFWKGIVSCKFPVQRKEPWRIHDNVGYCTPIAHLYYQPEGSSEWKLLRCDTEYLFNRNYPGSESAKMDEAFNYLYVIPKSW